VPEEATGWFERLYAAAESGDAEVPWDRGGPNPTFAQWIAERQPDGAGRRALAVGCAFGDDAELVAAQGFATTAFDVAPTAIAGARARFPDSPVEYAVADVLEPPAAWRQAFDLVVECITGQSMPPAYHAAASASIASFVAPGGTLLVVTAARDEGEAVDGPPWPLTRAELDGFLAGGLELAELDELEQPGGTPVARRWRAEYRREP
jgi:SAM-dependent methyltransferase